MVTLRTMGDRAVLAEVSDLDAVMRLRAALAASRPEGVVDIVPAARTVLVRVDPRRMTVDRARSWILRASSTDAAASASAEASVVELEVRYDGPDLAETAALLGIGADELVRSHRAAEWTVAFTGFAAGFGYLVSDDWPFEVPRLDEPRTRVATGAVGLAGGFTGAYPRASPGGWRLIGTTPATLFDPDADPPALLTPGIRVRFREAADSVRPSARLQGTAETSGLDRSLGVPLQSRGHGPAVRPADGTVPGGAVRVVEPGLLATIQDLGRPGHAALGVATSGALDRGALRLANRLVGNDEAAAGIEVTMGGFRAVALRDLWVAVTGAWGPIRIGGSGVDPYESHAWPAGDELELGWFDHGARAYIAVRGGIGGASALGSRSTDRMADLGPSPLRGGDDLPVTGALAGAIPIAEVAPWGAPHDDEILVAVTPGPRDDWFTAGASLLLFDSVWTVTNDADRVGIRLDGPELPRARAGELPSEGMVAGALQVPPSGRPTILLADGPVTGGYPVIAVVADASLDALAQVRPGSSIRFRHAPPLG